MNLRQRRRSPRHSATFAAWITALPHPELIDQDAELWVPLVVPDALRRELEPLGVQKRDPGRSVDDSAIHLCPERSGGGGIRGGEILRTPHLAVEFRLTETRAVEIDIRVGPIGRAAQKVDEEVRCTWQVRAPPVDAELDARPRISRSVVEVDRVRIKPQVRLEAELSQQSRDVSSRRLLGRIVTGAGDQHGLAPRAGGGDQTPRSCEIGPFPLSGGARVGGVRAGGPVAGDSRRQDLARRPPKLPPAPESEKLFAVDRKVQRAPYPNIVERWKLRVEPEEIRRRFDKRMREAREARRDLAQPLWWRLLQREVGFPRLDGGRRRGRVEPEGVLEAIRIASRLRFCRPLVEVRVAHEHQLAIRRVALDEVRPRSRQRRLGLCNRRGARRNERAERQRELEEKVRIRL